MNAQKEVSQKLAATLEKLRREKQAVLERFEERIEKNEKEKQDTNSQSERLIAEEDSKTDLLRNIREATNKSENIREVSETFKEISTQIKAGAERVVFLKYTEISEESVTEIVEKALENILAQKTESVQLGPNKLFGTLGKPVGK